jgi:16S rRNA (cytidine1402-2'-O)-methyltransferase
MTSSIDTSFYLVPTPIGNLQDITYRAVEILKKVDTILAEDTRKSGILLHHYGIGTKMKSFHAFNEHKQLNQLVDRLLEGETMALITDAGMPGISDPGFLLARACVENGVSIECLPGPTAFIPALIKSALPADRFVFEGFLPHKKGRKTRIELLQNESRTIILYESPHRIVKTLGQFIEYMGTERRASVSRELTKKYEETVNGTLQSLYEHFSSISPKGEFVLIIAGKN